MKRIFREQHIHSLCDLLGLIILLAVVSSVSAADQPALDPHLTPLRGWLGKTFKSEGKDPDSAKPATDVARWERALNGKAVRILHSINDGSYGGECIIMWDEEKQAVCYHYFTTAALRTEGTMTFESGKLVTHEFVKGNANGVSEVRGTTEMRPDGTFSQRTEFLKGGKWMPGREAIYKENPTAEVVFK